MRGEGQSGGVPDRRDGCRWTKLRPVCRLGGEFLVRPAPIPPNQSSRSRFRGSHEYGQIARGFEGGGEGDPDCALSLADIQPHDLWSDRQF